MTPAPHRLRKHADYQRVYRTGRKQFAKNIGYFYALRSTSPEAPPPGDTAGPRVGLTVPKALGNAVARNRIKRRMREAVRHALPLLHAPVDLVLHPRRIVREMEFALLEREVAGLFRSVQAACERAPAPEPDRRPRAPRAATTIAVAATTVATSASHNARAAKPAKAARLGRKPATGDTLP